MLRVVLRFRASTRRLLLLPLVERALHATLLQQVPGVQRAVAGKARLGKGGEGKEEAVTTTEGVNLPAVWRASLESAASTACSRSAGSLAWMGPPATALVDVLRLRTNDIGQILRWYGVEACRNSIVREVRGVFGVYGIKVSPRHLGLIADYMTFMGGYRPLNRLGMSDTGSTMQ